MKIWAVVNKKGGCSKSTLATQLGVYASQTGLKTLIVDLDPQGSARVWHAERGEGTAPTVHWISAEQLPKLVRSVKSADGLVDLIIIDTAPAADRGIITAIGHADLIICPTLPGLLNKAATDDTLTLIDQAGMLDRVIGVGVRITPGSKSVMARSYDEACLSMETRGIRVAANYICERASYRAAVDAGKGVTEMKPVDEKAAKELQALFQELQETWPAIGQVETA